MKKVASIFGATLFGIFTSVANAGSPIALTESEMDAVTAGMGFFSNRLSNRLTTNQIEEPIIEQNPVFSFPSYSVEELIIEERVALSFPSYSAMEEYRQTLNLSESTESFAFVITGQSSYRDIIDKRVDLVW